jgi:8-oxo-dGTP diphosphatase
MTCPSLQVGGVYFKNDDVLLVKINYGANKGMWMLPGGFLEEGESIEEAVIREVNEETGLLVKPFRIVGLRSGVQLKNNERQTTVYIAFEVGYLSGSILKDENEIEDIRLWNIADIANSEEIIELSKEIIWAAAKTRYGLYKGDAIRTNNKYLSYSYYLPNVKDTSELEEGPTIL